MKISFVLVLLGLAFAQEAQIISAGPIEESVPAQKSEVPQSDAPQSTPQVEEKHLPEPDLSGPSPIDLNKEDDEPEHLPIDMEHMDSLPIFPESPRLAPIPRFFPNFPIPNEQEQPPNFLNLLPEILKDLPSPPEEMRPAEIEIEMPRLPIADLLGNLLGPRIHRHNPFHHFRPSHLPVFMSAPRQMPFPMHPPSFFSHASPFHIIPMPSFHVPHMFNMPQPAPFVPELPVHLQNLLSERHESIPNDHQPMIMKMEQKHGFFVVTGWFPGVAKEDLTVKLNGANLMVTGKISDKSDAVRQDLAEFGDIDEVDETMQLPYAPDAHLFKAHFDGEKHTLTAVFPEQSEVNITLE